jgi:hypothetical protein
MAEIKPVSNDPQLLRCRRFVGTRARARDGECGLSARVVLNGQPLCYVHTPVAYRRQLGGAQQIGQRASAGTVEPR